jgi:hypothetical protein
LPILSSLLLRFQRSRRTISAHQPPHILLALLFTLRTSEFCFEHPSFIYGLTDVVLFPQNDADASHPALPGKAMSIDDETTIDERGKYLQETEAICQSRSRRYAKTEMADSCHKTDTAGEFS